MRERYSAVQWGTLEEVVPDLSALINLRNHLIGLPMADGSMCDISEGVPSEVSGRSDYMYSIIQTPFGDNVWHPRDIRS
jgi:hypothetical protein